MNKNYISFGIIAFLVISVLFVFKEPSEQTVEVMSEEQRILEEQKEEIESLKRENEKLLLKMDELSKYQAIEDLSEESNAKVERLTDEVGYLEGEIEQLRELISRYQVILDLVDQQTNVLSEKLSVFSHKHLSVGSKIAGLTVSDIQDGIFGEESFIVGFSGEFSAKGSLMLNHGGGGSKYLFMIEEELEKVPHSLYEFERGRIFFNVTNEEEIEVAFGEILQDMDPFGSIKLEAVFTNYSHVYVPFTDMSSHAEFVRVVAME